MPDGRPQPYDTTTEPSATPSGSGNSVGGLRRLNRIVGTAHAVQAVVLLLVASAASLPVSAFFLTGPPGAGDYGAASLNRAISATSSRTPDSIAINTIMSDALIA